MHANSVRAGHLDLDGCTIVDMLPRYISSSRFITFYDLLDYEVVNPKYSNFIPTCSECSTSHPPPGIVSVRGESSIIVCRECHHRMSTLSWIEMFKHNPLSLQRILNSTVSHGSLSSHILCYGLGGSWKQC